MGLRQFEFQFLTNGDLSLASLTSPVADCTNMLGFSIQAVTTGSGVGVLAVEGSNQPEVNTSFTGNIPSTSWTTIVSANVSAPGSIMINVSDTFYRWVRVVYTRTSGTGTINAILMGKGA